MMGAKDGEEGWEALSLSSPWGENWIECIGEEKNAACSLNQIKWCCTRLNLELVLLWFQLLPLCLYMVSTLVKQTSSAWHPPQQMDLQELVRSIFVLGSEGCLCPLDVGELWWCEALALCISGPRCWLVYWININKLQLSLTVCLLQWSIFLPGC